MAEDDRAVTEGSASWGLQGGMGLHLCRGCLELSPPAESGDASAVSQRPAVLEKDLQAAADATKTLPLSRKSRNLASILSRAVVFPQPARETLTVESGQRITKDITVDVRLIKPTKSYSNPQGKPCKP